MSGSQTILEITPEEGGSVAGNMQTAAAAAVTEGMKMTAEKEPRKLSAEFAAAAGRVTVTAAVSREADSVDAAGLWTAAEDMELGTADGAAGTAAANTQAAMSEAVELETEAVAAADKKAESEGSGMESAENMEAAAAGDEGFAGCNMESGFAAHMRWDPAVRKVESAAHTRCCPLYFVSCFAFPWDISGESVAHRAVLDSRVLAVALPEVPAAVCRGCFLHTAEASSSPSDPLGLKAAKQIVTHDIHPAAYRNCSQLQKKKTEENFTRLMQSSKSHLPLCGCCNPQFCSEVQHGFQRPFKQQTFHKEQAQ